MTQQEGSEQLQQHRVGIFIASEIFQFELFIVFVIIILLFLGYFDGQKERLRQKYQSLSWILNLQS